MDDFDPVAYLKEAGGVFKFGSGVLGKSSIALGIIMIATVVAVFRLHSDTAIIATLLIAAVIFFAWLFPVLKFANRHPDVALLEGTEWSEYQRFQASAKGYLPSAADRESMPLPGSQAALTDGKPNKAK